MRIPKKKKKKKKGKVVSSMDMDGTARERVGCFANPMAAQRGSNYMYLLPCLQIPKVR